MGEVASLKNRKMVGILAAVAAVWIIATISMHFGTFGLSRYLGWAVAADLAHKILGFLNSWWGFAAAVAAAAAFGLSWTVVVIKGVLQKAGLRFALEYATWL